MRLCHDIAAEQVAWWRANGVSAADALESLGYAVGPRRRHVGRTWAELEDIIAREWWDAVNWRRMQEAA